VGYELHPETPPDGRPLAGYLPDAEGMLRYVRSFAARFGLELVPPTRVANTRRAHAAAQRARDVGKLDAFRAAAFDAYWQLGRDLADENDLAAIGEAAGIGGQLAVAAGADPGTLARVDAARRAAIQAGVTGVPTFVFTPDAGARSGAETRVVGCQPYEVLAEAARRAGAPRR